MNANKKPPVKTDGLKKFIGLCHCTGSFGCGFVADVDHRQHKRCADLADKDQIIVNAVADCLVL